MAEPALPEGLGAFLTSDNATCQVGGRPTMPAAEAVYTITASNPSGQSSATVTVTVITLPAPVLASSGPYVFTRDRPITPITFANSGVAPQEINHCFSSPELPLGLRVAPSADGSSCTLSGTPVEGLSQDEYSFTAVNGGTEGMVRISIEIGFPTMFFVRRSDIASGTSHTCALLTGGLYCWGKGENGRLGLGHSNDRASPSLVGDTGSWKGVSAGDAHTCAINSINRLYCWGKGENGRLGLGHSNDINTPAEVGRGFNWLSVSAGATHTCAVTRGNGLFCWGAGDFGQLGQGNTASFDIPTEVGYGPIIPDTPPELRYTTNWITISAGTAHTMAINHISELLSWGDRPSGALGQGSINMKYDSGKVLGINAGQGTATINWALVSAGTDHTCGIDIDGKLYCWGNNDNGRLGDGNTSTSTGRFDRNSPVQAGATTGWIMVSAGAKHTCAVRYGDGLYCWGEGADNQLGLNNTSDRNIPTKIGSENNWHSVSAGGSHTCAFRTNGLYCWGKNDSGQLGLGHTENSATPTEVRKDQF